MEKEVIFGDVVAKSNNYLAVPGGGGQKRIIKSDAVRNYEKSFLDQCKIYANKSICVPFRLEIDVYFSNHRKDLDNALKTILDCLQYAKAISDDNLCTEIVAKKFISRRPRIEFTLQKLTQTLF